MKSEFQILNRRNFFRAVAGTGAMLGATPLSALPQSSQNPFAYDLTKYQKTDPKLVSHEILTRWTCPRKGSRHITVSPDNRIYVCAGNYVASFSQSGEPGVELALTDSACCASVPMDGKIFAATRSTVEVFDASGRRVGGWKSPDAKSWFTGIAAGERDVFVADSSRRVVLRFDRSGKVAGKFGKRSEDKQTPGFIIPSPFLQVLIHKDGLLRANNIGRHSMETWSPEGEFSGAWGRYGMAIESFCGCCNPIGFALLGDGRIVTAEKGLPRVKIYSAAGGFESVVAGVESCTEKSGACSGLNDCAHGGLSVAVDSHDNICVLDLVTNEVRIMRPKA